MKNKVMSTEASPIVLPTFRDGIFLNAILESAYTGNVGDGKIFVSDVLEAYRIRTKESGHSGIN